MAFARSRLGNRGPRLNALAKALKVRPGEGTRVAWLIALMLATSAGGSIGGNGIEALFISRFGVGFLPHMYISLGFVTLATSLVIAALMGRVAKHRLFAFLPLVLAGALIAERLLVATGLRFAFPVAWLGMNVQGMMQGLLTWGLAGMFLDTRQAKRLFPLLGAANILGAVVGGLVTPSLVRVISSENLMIVWAGALGLAFLIGKKVTAAAGASSSRPRSGESLLRSMTYGYTTVRRSAFLRWTAGGSALFAVLMYSIAFPFSKAAATRYPDADALASFFGVFQGLSTGVAFLVSLLVANRLFTRFGVMKSIAAFPLIYACGFATLAATGGFAPIVAFRFAQMVWMQGVFFSAYQAGYNVIPPGRKDQARAFIDGVPGQAGTVVAGALLLLGEQALTPGVMFWIGLGAALVCLTLAIKAMRAYTGALLEALREGRPQVFFSEEEPFGGFAHDAAAVSAVISGITNPDRTTRRVSAEILGHISAPRATDALVIALKDRDPPVRIAAIKGLVGAGASQAILEIASRLHDPEPEVRAEAIDALRTLARYPEGVAREIRSLLTDHDPSVRARVALALGDDPEAARVLRDLASGTVTERVSLLEGMGRSPPEGILETVSAQAAHDSPAVRIGAARALRGFERPEAIDLLIDMLADPEPTVSAAAAESAAAFGDRSVEKLVNALAGSRSEWGALLALEQTEAELPVGEVLAYARTAAAAAHRYAHLALGNGASDASALMNIWLIEKRLTSASNAIRAVGLLSQRRAVAIALDNLKSADSSQRANALETLEGIGHREIIQPLLSLFEGDFAGATEDDPVVRLRELMLEEDPWLRALAVLSAGEALPEEAARLAGEDPHPLVRQAVDRIMAKTHMDTLGTISPIERILFLRQVPLFSVLGPDDLKQLASIAGERAYSDGELICEEGEPGDELFVVISGEVSVVVGQPPNQVEVARRRAAEYVGELSVITSQPRSASLLATGDVRLLVIDRLHFDSLLRERPHVSIALVRAMGERLLEAGRTFPAALSTKLQTARDRRAMVGERRVVTVLFCDVAGSTEMAERLDPEVWADVMSRAMDILNEPVHRYEGTLARMMGDAILAFFGAPLAHEDDPERAVRAGLEMVEGIAGLRRELAAELDLDFNVRVGINTGLVVVGELGRDFRLEYTAIGDAVNVAARMEQTAEPSSVQLSDETARLVGHAFDLEDLGPKEVKGKRKPVNAFRVIGAKSTRERGRGVEALASALVGREHEMEKLRAMVDGVRAGRGGIAFLVGEAGLGKSRLISELRSEWRVGSGGAGMIHWAEARAVSYDAQTPYSQLQQYLRNLTGVSPHDQPGVARDKIARASAQTIGAAPERVAAIYELLLGVEESPSALAGEELQREVLEVVASTVRGWAAASPSVLVADDLHWSDPASAELLTSLLSLCSEVPLLFLCASRPPAEAVLPQARETHPEALTEIALDPLSPDDSRELVGRLLTAMDLPPDLSRLIQDKAAGNPFFIEEILRELIEEKVIVPHDGSFRVTVPAAEIAIPDRVQSLLASRIDSLQPDVRQTLQYAAVIGGRFHYRILKELSELPEDLGDHIDKLERAGLIAEVAEIPELEFAFRHPLIAEAAYESILIKERTALHKRVGEELARVFEGREVEVAETLARHFSLGGDARALPYCMIAGARAARLHAHREAASYYGSARSLAKKDAEGADLRSLYSALGTSLQLIGDFPQAVEIFKEMCDIAGERGDRKMEIQALGRLATVYSTPNQMHDPSTARNILERLLTVAREVGDRRMEARSLWNLMLNLQYDTFGASEAIEHGEKALAIARELEDLEQVGFVLNDIAYPRFMNGDLAAAIDSLDQAGKIWEELDNQPMLADSILRSAQIHVQAGSFEVADRKARAGLAISERIGNEWGQGYALTNLADVLWQTGALGEAVEARSRAVDLSTRGGFMVGATAVRAELAWSLAELGDLNRAMETATLADSVAKEQFSFMRPWPLAILSRLSFRLGDIEGAAHQAAQIVLKPSGSVIYFASLIPLSITRAEIDVALGRHQAGRQNMDELIEVLNNLHALAWVPEALLHKARALVAGGDDEAAREALDEARRIAKQTGGKWVLWQVLADLAALESRVGNAEASDEYRQSALDIVTTCAMSLGDSPLRESFLARADIRMLQPD